MKKTYWKIPLAALIAPTVIAVYAKWLAYVIGTPVDYVAVWIFAVVAGVIAPCVVAALISEDAL